MGNLVKELYTLFEYYLDFKVFVFNVVHDAQFLYFKKFIFPLLLHNETLKNFRTEFFSFNSENIQYSDILFELGISYDDIVEHVKNNLTRYLDPEELESRRKQYAENPDEEIAKQLVNIHNPNWITINAVVEIFNNLEHKDRRIERLFERLMSDNVLEDFVWFWQFNIDPEDEDWQKEFENRFRMYLRYLCLFGYKELLQKELQALYQEYEHPVFEILLKEIDQL